jgi:hypothetical protein
MADRTGFNSGAVEIDALRGETLDYQLGVSGASANFALVDDETTQVLTDQNFPIGQNTLGWRLKFTAMGTNVRVTVIDAAGNQIGTYQRDIPVSVADAGPIPIYGITLLFITAVGYTLTVNHTRSNSVKDKIADVQYKNGQPGDHGSELIAIDFA